MLTDRIAAAFDGKALAVRSSDGSNRVVFATDGPSMHRFDREFSRRWAGLPEVHRRTLRSAATRLRHGLLGRRSTVPIRPLPSASR